jgi:hypothetical protein
MDASREAEASPDLSDTVVTGTSVPSENVTTPIQLLPKSWQKLSTASLWYTYKLTRECRCTLELHTNTSTDTEQHCYTACSAILTTILKRALTRVNLLWARAFYGQQIIQSVAQVIVGASLCALQILTLVLHQTESSTYLCISPLDTKLEVSDIESFVTVFSYILPQSFCNVRAPYFCSTFQEFKPTENTGNLERC